MDAALDQQLGALIEKMQRLEVDGQSQRHAKVGTDLIHEIQQRSRALSAAVCKTVSGSHSDVSQIVGLFQRWMLEGAVVRILGAGRARLCAAVPANRLAHGGARVYVQDDIIPLPHTIKGGGVIAASASGKTRHVLEALKIIREEAPQIVVVGIGDSASTEFRALCHHYIGIQEDDNRENPLRALADVGEFVISEVLDSLVVAAGKLAGFDDRKWRLGHEDVGPTGPYQARVSKVDLLFNERY